MLAAIRSHLLLLAAAGLVCGTGPAAATDPHVVARKSWNGCYVGANAASARADVAATDSPFTDGPFAGTGFSWNSSGPNYETIDMNNAGASVGIEAGCDVELPGTLPLIVGGVVDFSLLDISGDGQSALYSDTKTRYDIDWASSLRARVGLEAGEILFFGSGGLALANINVRAFDNATAPTFGRMDVSGGGSTIGWAAGLGAEWRAKPNLSLSIEYLHYDFGSVTATGPAFEPVGAFPRFENDLRLDTIRVGLKWRM